MCICFAILELFLTFKVFPNVKKNYKKLFFSDTSELYRRLSASNTQKLKVSFLFRPRLTSCNSKEHFWTLKTLFSFLLYFPYFMKSVFKVLIDNVQWWICAQINFHNYIFKSYFWLLKKEQIFFLKVGWNMTSNLLCKCIEVWLDNECTDNVIAT